jgi:hypothetical protein
VPAHELAIVGAERWWIIPVVVIRRRRTKWAHTGLRIVACGCCGFLSALLLPAALLEEELVDGGQFDRSVHVENLGELKR